MFFIFFKSITIPEYFYEKKIYTRLIIYLHINYFTQKKAPISAERVYFNASSNSRVR